MWQGSSKEGRDGHTTPRDTKTTQRLRRGPHRRPPQSRTPSQDPEGHRNRTGSQMGTALGWDRGGRVGSIGPPPVAGCGRRTTDLLGTTRQNPEGQLLATFLVFLDL